MLNTCPRCRAAKFCTACYDQSFTIAHYCREISVKQEKLQSLEASYVRAQRHYVLAAAPHETIHLQDEMLWCAAQVGNCLVEMANKTFPTIQEGAYLYDQALQLYQSAMQRPGLSVDRHKAIESQMMLLLVILDRDDQVMKLLTRQGTADRYSLLSADEVRDLTLDSCTVPYLIFCIKAKIVGLARTMGPKLDAFLQTSGQRVDEVKYELADYLYGHAQTRVRNQMAQIALVGSAWIIECRRRLVGENVDDNCTTIPMVLAILDETETFEKADWPAVFRVQVPAVFWSIFRRFVLNHPEIYTSLQFLAEALVDHAKTGKV